MTQPEFDDLWPGGPRFVRSGAGFALGTDSVLLADFAAQRRARRIADLGCGAGVLTVLLLGVYGPGFEASNFIYSQF